MDIKNGRITIGEILANPAARAYLRQNYPMLLQNPLVGRFRGMQLQTALQYASRWLSQGQINALLTQLKAL